MEFMARLGLVPLCPSSCRSCCAQTLLLEKRAVYVPVRARVLLSQLQHPLTGVDGMAV